MKISLTLVVFAAVFLVCSSQHGWGHRRRYGRWPQGGWRHGGWRHGGWRQGGWRHGGWRHGGWRQGLWLQRKLCQKRYILFVFSFMLFFLSDIFPTSEL